LDEEEVLSQSSQEWQFFEFEKQKFDLDYNFFSNSVLSQISLNFFIIRDKSTNFGF
jgi:hypothetical protein